ncbi:unnamed protein product [Durusdinium trenchii]|uniref:EF-hand domain-containing protein n=2 Tax=Durusdinium trenchii TaxID=1381693 RepID=A0ABP0L1L6_9DINO
MEAEAPDLKSFIQQEFQKQSLLLLGLSDDVKALFVDFSALYHPLQGGSRWPSEGLPASPGPKPHSTRVEEKVMAPDQEEQHPDDVRMSGHRLNRGSVQSTGSMQSAGGQVRAASVSHTRTTSHNHHWDHNIQLQFAEKKNKDQAKIQDPTVEGSSNSLKYTSCFMVKGQQFVASNAFNYTILFLILLNLVLLGIEVDLASGMPYGESPAWFAEINLLVVGIFCFEVIAKIFFFGIRHFFCGREPWWNIFDFMVVLLSVLEVLIEFFIQITTSEMDTSNLRVMRFVRVARTLRGVRVIRLLRYIGSLRTIMFSIVSTLGSLFWTLILLLMLWYCFSVIITQSVADYCRLNFLLDNNDTCPLELTRHWSSVAESMLTLFLAITGGLSWSDALFPLRSVGFTPFISLCVYIVITVFAVLNVVTGVFCNTAIESAGADREIAIMKQMKKQDQQMETLREIFEEIDIDCSSQINLAELKDALRSAKLRTFMNSLGISTEDVWTLFMTVDTDGSGEISLDEFVHGCMQLQGPAKGLQVARMSYENTVMRAEMKKIREDVLHFQTEMIRASQTRGRPLSIQTGSPTSPMISG